MCEPKQGIKKQRREAWLKDNGPCVRCGSWERLQIDHIDPSQKVTHDIWHWSEKRRNEELAKCQVLCYNCHTEKSIKNRDLVSNVILKDDDVRLIKTLLKTGMAQGIISELFDVTRSTIRDINIGRTWKHVII